MFENASNVNIGKISNAHAQPYGGSSSIAKVDSTGPHLESVEINAGVYTHNEFHGADPLKELCSHTAVGAIHNSADQVDAPKCHEETRKAVQEDIFSWMTHGTANEVLWLTGPAGAGKSAIMGTVSDKLEEKGLLAATFFFSSYKGSVERMSKRRFVTTLAYQLLLHPGSKERLSPPMLSAIQQNPAVFDMNLKRQFEVLILQPLRVSHDQLGSTASLSTAILIDGVDECGEERYDNIDRSRQDDQIEVLSILLQAVKDPAFPFRIIVASRPETWIRTFFTKSASDHFVEIFLDNKYDPDDDIALFFKSKFAELSRRYGYPPTWPRPEDLAKLVEDASGQFIYAATVIRFIETPGRLPHKQLDIVLNIQPQDKSSPFAALDALYTSILKSSPSPDDTALWLKALQISKNGATVSPSAWTIHRLFESSTGEARMLLELPSLFYLDTVVRQSYDTVVYGKMVPVPVLDEGWNSVYVFYHKSFLDFLDDSARCGADFPDLDDGRVERWLWGRVSRVLTCDGPEVPIDPALLLTFKRCFLDIWIRCAMRPPWDMALDEDVVAKCNLAQWLAVSNTIESEQWPDPTFQRNTYILVHKNCRSYRPCRAGCKRWRKAILECPGDVWRPDRAYKASALLLDRFCIKRIDLYE